MNKKLWALSILGVLGIIILWIGLHFLVRPAVGVAERTLNPDNIIYNYEWFYDQYNDIQGLGVRIANAEQARDDYAVAAGERNTWDYATTTEYNRLNGLLLGLQNNQANEIAEYNARASMMNRHLFQAGELPEHL